MIPQANITEWSQRAPWSTDAQIEQDLILSRTIIEIFSDPFLANELAFRGGTALQKLFMESPLRYSEDIDLVQVNQTPIGSILDKLREKIDPYLAKAKYEHKQGRVNLVYKFQSEIPPITPLRLKIEINTREHFAFLGLQNKNFQVNSAWFTGNSLTKTFLLEEILATKLRALYQRKKGRDLFDLSTTLKQFSDIDKEKIIFCFNKYLEAEKLKVSYKEFSNCLNLKLKDIAFLNDINPLLPVTNRIKYEPIEEADFVKQEVITLLK